MTRYPGSIFYVRPTPQGIMVVEQGYHGGMSYEQILGYATRNPHDGSEGAVFAALIFDGY